MGDGRKVVIADTDHINAFERNPAWVWKSFLSGVNPIVMDHYNGSQWDPIRAAMGDARSYVDRINLALMTLRIAKLLPDTVCSQGVPSI
jgi:hypothetical protein